MSDLMLGRDRLGDPEASTRLAWLITNGIGGYASGTVSGALTRRHHGLLFAALEPPLGCTLLLAKLSETLEVDGASHELDTNCWTSGDVHPRGHVHLESFRIEDTIPAWTWAIGDTRLEKRVWMEHGENTTYVQYRLAAARGAVRLSLQAVVNHRDAREILAHGEWEARVEPATGGLRIEAYDGATPLWLLAPGATLRPHTSWYRGYALAREAELGLASREDHLCVGDLHVRLAPGEVFTVVASTRRDAGTGVASPLALVSALARRRAHERSLAESWKTAQPSVARTAPAWVRRLVLAADDFVVERSSPSDPNGRTVIAGYPWFGDRGRDAMASLPGLLVAAGRPEIAKAVLATFARHVDGGMLPGYFPDQGEHPEYDSVDSALWFFQAVRAYHEATGDDRFLAEVYPVLEDVGAWNERGTRFGIVVDPDDGLLAAGEDGTALTWMNARAGDRALTPRVGKPVEVNALWYNALTTLAGFAKRLKRASESYESLARRVERGVARFWNPETGCLYDVLDGPAGNDAAIRPNQILAVSLPDSPLSPSQRRSVIDVCGRMLLTSHGLRTLAPPSPAYRGRHLGDPAARAGAQHQGTAAVWLLPHFAIAHERVHGRREEALALLEPLASLIRSHGLGMLPELADGDAPHAPRGALAHAWAVGEALRAYHALAAEKRKPVRRRAPAGAAREAATVH